MCKASARYWWLVIVLFAVLSYVACNHSKVGLFFGEMRKSAYIAGYRLSGVIRYPFDSIKKIRDYIKDRDSDDQYIDKLLIENHTLKIQLLDLERVRKENQYLSGLIRLYNEHNVGLVGARVLSRGLIHSKGMIVLDIGADADVKPGNLVAEADHLLGYVSSVQNNRAIVSTLFNQNFRMPVILEGGQKAVLYGGDNIYLKYLGNPEKVKDGELVMTESMFGGDVRLGVGSSDNISAVNINSDEVSLNKPSLTSYANINPLSALLVGRVYKYSEDRLVVKPIVRTEKMHIVVVLTHKHSS